MPPRWRDLGRSWEDWVNLILGAWLMASPWVLGFNFIQAATYNSLCAGLAVFLIAIVALVRFETLGEWVNVVVGLWLIFSPWTFNFAYDWGPLLNSILVGAAVALLAGIELWQERLRHLEEEEAARSRAPASTVATEPRPSGGWQRLTGPIKRKRRMYVDGKPL